MKFRKPGSLRAATIVAVTLGIAVTGCTAKKSDSTAKSGEQIAVNATDTGCELSASEGAPGSTTFAITNNGAKVTEFYVYSGNGGVLGEAENISPGLQRTLVVDLREPGAYQVACKPGMVGDGVRTTFTVKR